MLIIGLSEGRGKSNQVYTGYFKYLNNPVAVNHSPHSLTLPFPIRCKLFRSSIHAARLVPASPMPLSTSSRLAPPLQYHLTSLVPQKDPEPSVNSKKNVRSSSKQPKRLLDSTAGTSSFPIKSWCIKKSSYQPF